MTHLIDKASIKQKVQEKLLNACESIFQFVQARLLKNLESI